MHFSWHIFFGVVIGLLLWRGIKAWIRALIKKELEK